MQDLYWASLTKTDITLSITLAHMFSNATRVYVYQEFSSAEIVEFDEGSKLSGNGLIYNNIYNVPTRS